MSKVTTGDNPARLAAAVAPTMPPAGPESTASRPRNDAASTSPPFDCMKNSGMSAAGAATCAT